MGPGILLAWAAAAAAAETITTGTASPLVRERVDPELPPELVVREAVTCSVVFQVGTDGLPESVQVSGCPDAFREPVRQAALRWRFRPQVLGGQAVPYRYTARFDFAPTAGEAPFRAEAGGAPVAGAVRVIHQEEPRVDEALLRRLGEVRCKVRIEVGADGVPERAEVVEAPDALREALVEAALRWRFEPVVVEGRAVPFTWVWSYERSSL